MSSIEKLCLSKAERSEILASSGAEACGAGSRALERKLSRNEDGRDFPLVMLLEEFDAVIASALDIGLDCIG